MSWWGRASEFSSLATNALKIAQNKIDKVLDIQESPDYHSRDKKSFRLNDEIPLDGGDYISNFSRGLEEKEVVQNPDYKTNQFEDTTSAPQHDVIIPAEDYDVTNSAVNACFASSSAASSRSAPQNDASHQMSGLTSSSSTSLIRNAPHESSISTPHQQHHHLVSSGKSFSKQLSSSSIVEAAAELKASASFTSSIVVTAATSSSSATPPLPPPPAAAAHPAASSSSYCSIDLVAMDEKDEQSPSKHREETQQQDEEQQKSDAIMPCNATQSVVHESSSSLLISMESLPCHSREETQCDATHAEQERRETTGGEIDDEEDEDGDDENGKIGEMEEKTTSEESEETDEQLEQQIGEHQGEGEEKQLEKARETEAITNTNNDEEKKDAKEKREQDGGEEEEQFVHPHDSPLEVIVSEREICTAREAAQLDGGECNDENHHQQRQHQEEEKEKAVSPGECVEEDFELAGSSAAASSDIEVISCGTSNNEETANALAHSSSGASMFIYRSSGVAHTHAHHKLEASNAGSQEGAKLNRIDDDDDDDVGDDDNDANEIEGVAALSSSPKITSLEQLDYQNKAQLIQKIKSLYHALENKDAQISELSANSTTTTTTTKTGKKFATASANHQKSDSNVSPDSSATSSSSGGSGETPNSPRSLTLAAPPPILQSPPPPPPPSDQTASQALDKLQRELAASVAQCDQLERRLHTQETREQQDKRALHAALLEKEEQIAQLLREGEGLAQTQLRSNNAIKRLTATGKELNERLAKTADKLARAEEDAQKSRRALEMREESEKRMAESANQLSKLVAKLEREEQCARSDREDAVEKVRSLEITLDSNAKENFSLRKELAEARTKLGEFEAESSRASRQQTGAEQRECDLRAELQERAEEVGRLRHTVSSREREIARLEDALHSCEAEWRHKMAEAERRAEHSSLLLCAASEKTRRHGGATDDDDVTTNTTANNSTNDNNQSIRDEAAAELIGQINALQRQLDEAADKEAELAAIKRELESQSRIHRRDAERLARQLQAANASQSEAEARHTQTAQRLEAVLLSQSELTARLRQSDSVVANQRAQIERLETTRLAEQREREKTRADTQKKEEGREKEERQRDSATANHSKACQTTQTNEEQPIKNEENEKDNNDDDDDEEAAAAAHHSLLHHSGGITWDGSSSLVLVEHLQSLVQRLHRERDQLKRDMQEKQRDAASVTRLLTAEKLETGRLEAERAGEAERAARLEKEGAELRTQHERLLELHGEKLEEVAELRMDLQDVKHMYQAQLDELCRDRPAPPPH